MPDVVMRKYYKFRGTDNLERLADILVNQRFYCPKPKELNDPMEGCYHAPELTKNSGAYPVGNTRYRVCSFSKEMHEILLWTHYADNQKGVAIEFIPSKQLRPVDYEDSLFTHEHGKRNPEYKALTIKLKKWVYEGEYRYINDQGHKYLDGKISRVLFGIYTPDSIKRFVRAYCDQIGIETVETELDSENYRIRIK
jgi:hypothetical protein